MGSPPYFGISPKHPLTCMLPQVSLTVEVPSFLSQRRQEKIQHCVLNVFLLISNIKLDVQTFKVIWLKDIIHLIMNSINL